MACRGAGPRQRRGCAPRLVRARWRLGRSDADASAHDAVLAVDASVWLSQIDTRSTCRRTPTCSTTTGCRPRSAPSYPFRRSRLIIISPPPTPAHLGPAVFAGWRYGPVQRCPACAAALLLPALAARPAHAPQVGRPVGCCWWDRSTRALFPLLHIPMVRRRRGDRVVRRCGWRQSLWGSRARRRWPRSLCPGNCAGGPGLISNRIGPVRSASPVALARADPASQRRALNRGRRSLRSRSICSWRLRAE
jgi:hypothetical protein